MNRVGDEPSHFINMFSGREQFKMSQAIRCNQSPSSPVGCLIVARGLSLGGMGKVRRENILTGRITLGGKPIPLYPAKQLQANELSQSSTSGSQVF
ncbi:hypothetical protein TNCV_2024291 [Trichonephila clavipes]|nr:hypothetical protein TNCV_2024291 [Trichonephila clavipes]